jgi:hypothetical protein
MGKGLPRSLSRNRALTQGIGAPGAGVGQAQAEAKLIETVLTFDGDAVALVDEAGVVAHGNKKIFDFPEGLIQFVGAVVDLAVVKDAAGVDDDFAGDFGLGTAAADAGATLATTEQDLVPTTAIGPATAGATTAKGASTTTESGALLDGTTTAKDVYLNVLVDDADHDVDTTPTNLLITGTVKLLWRNLGDL